MKCKVCKKPAVINLRAQNRGLCASCFDAYILDRVERTIKRFAMFTRKEKVLVAVSGGKDSLALWDMLFRLDYSTTGLFIDVGIKRGSYSQRSREKVRSFAQEKGLPLVITSLKEWWGREIEEIGRKVLCPTCGMAKRYISNRLAVENDFAVLCTGHNLDDEVAVLFSNALGWQIGFLARQAPALESWHPKLARKAKPLVLLTEKEVALYAYLRGINYTKEPCPHAKGASSLFYKKLLNLIEWRSPGVKIRFYTEFLKHKSLFLQTVERQGLKECEICGQPTQDKVCAFCKIKEGRKDGNIRGKVSERDKIRQR